MVKTRKRLLLVHSIGENNPLQLMLAAVKGCTRSTDILSEEQLICLPL